MIAPSPRQGALRAEQVEARDWDRAVVSHPAATIFHTRAWMRVIQKTYGHQPMWMQIFEDDTPRALVPLVEVDSWITGRRGVCLPFSDFCAPLFLPGGKMEHVRLAVAEWAKQRSWKYFEIRSEAAASPSAPAFVAHTLDLPADAATLFGRLHSSVRRAIRQAERSGARITVARTGEAMRQFEALHSLTRQRHGVPSQPGAFFENLWREVIEPGWGFLVNAEWRGRPAAAAVFLQWGRHAVYKFSASDRRLAASRANHLVLWQGIQALGQAGAAVLHLGRTASNNNGLLRFKRGWATQESGLFYQRFDGATGLPAAAKADYSRFSPRLFRLLPRGLNRLSGQLLYPHID